LIRSTEIVCNPIPNPNPNPKFYWIRSTEIVCNPNPNPNPNPKLYWIRSTEIVCNPIPNPNTNLRFSSSSKSATRPPSLSPYGSYYNPNPTPTPISNPNSNEIINPHLTLTRTLTLDLVHHQNPLYVRHHCHYQNKYHPYLHFLNIHFQYLFVKRYYNFSI
jgi:hypothetical protein